MSRRILLVDTDRAFHRLLAEQIGPYGFEIVTASPTDPDVLAKVTQLNPTVLIIAVEEPDKLGYSLCNKAKKGVAANLPVILATSTVAPQGFANHRKLKIHADEYIDKRGLNPAEVVGKIDNLIGLGEMVPQDHRADLGSDDGGDELQIPVEVEDLPLDLADAEVVEQLDDGVNDFADEGGRTAIAPPGVMDSLMDADLDGAFAAITDFSDEHHLNLPPAKAPPVAASEPAAPMDYVSDEASLGVPEPIDPIDQPAFGDELEASESSEWSGEIPEPIDLGDFDGDEQTSTDMPASAMRGMGTAGAAPVAPPSVARKPKPPTMPPPVPPPPAPVIAAPPPPPPEPPEPEPELALPEPVIAAPPPPPAPAPEPEPEPLPAPESGLDLGLDEVAARAENEQSGVHDRRTLQKIHVLERENAKLKADLDKAKTAGDGVKTQGKEREFLHLREMIATKDKEILELRDELVVKDRQITDAKEKIRQLQHTKTMLEGKNLEMEQRIVSDADKVEAAETTKKELDVKVADLAARLAAVEAKAKTDAEAAARTLAEKVASAAALDKELSASRARLTDAEQKHTDSIAQLTRTRDAAETRLRGELDKAREEVLEALRTELGAAHAEKTAALTTSLTAEHTTALSAREQNHAAAIAAVVAHHEEKHAETTSALEAALAASRDDASRAVEAARAEHARTLAADRAQAADALAAERARADQAVSDAATTVQDTTAAERARADKAIAEAASRAQEDMVAVVAAHQTEMERQGGEHIKTVEQLRTEHDTKLAQSRTAAITERDRLTSEHAGALAALTADRDAVHADLTAVRGELQQSRSDLTALAERAQRDLAAAVGEIRTEKAEVEKGLSSSRERVKALEGDLTTARDTIATREREVEEQAAAVAERDQRLAALRGEIDELEKENAGYQEQVLKAYQKIKNDENTVTRAKKAMAIALTLLDEEKKKGAHEGE